MVIEGVDYAWDVPRATALAAAGKKFAVRYGGPGSAGKQLQGAELAKLKAAGIDIVANAEGAAGGFRGRTAGAAWAKSAAAYFAELGMPKSRPIYFSVDWNAGAADWLDIDAALAGAASVIGAAQVGVYGGYHTIAHCAAAGSARWFWQTYAWSADSHGNTLWHPVSHLQQYRNNVKIDGANLDLTRAMTADYGQWGFQEDDVTKQDLLDALDQYFAMAPSTNADKMPESVIGKRAWYQPIPNPFQGGKRTTAWEMFVDLCTAVNGGSIAQQILQGLNVADLAKTIVQALPADLAKQLADELVDELAQRLSA